MSAKRHWSITFAVVQIIFIFCMIVLIRFLGPSLMSESSKGQKEAFRKQVEKVNEYNYDIMYYGEDIKMPDGLKARRIETLSPHEFDPDDMTSSFTGKMLIINDPDGQIKIDDDTWKLIFKLYDEDDYTVIYLGSSQFENMAEAGFVFDANDMNFNSVLFMDSGSYKREGIADSSEYLPYIIEKDLDPMQLQFYRTISELAKVPPGTDR